LQVVIGETSVDRFLEQLRAAVRGRAWPTVRGFASPSPATPKLKAPPESSLESLLSVLPRVAKNASSVAIGFGELSRLRWGQRPDGATIYLSLALSPKDEVFSDPADCVRAPTHLLRSLLANGSVKTAAVERLGDGVCVPLVPLAKTRRPLLVTSETEVAAEYERPDDFWSAGWTIERFGDLRLLTRCQNVVTKGDVLREIQDHQWQMARAAKPGRTKYSSPEVAADEKPVYED